MYDHSSQNILQIAFAYSYMLWMQHPSEPSSFYLLWICPLHTYALLTQALVMGMHVLPGPAERTHHEEDLRESCMHSERPMHTGETSESSGIPISNMISTMYAPPKTSHVTCKYVKSN